MPGPSKMLLVTSGAICGTPMTWSWKSLNISLDWPATLWHCDALGRAEKQQCAALLVVSQGVVVAACKAVDGRVGEGQAELELGDGLAEHVEGDGRAVLDFPEALAKELSIRQAAVQPVEHLSPDRVVVAGKRETGHLRALGRWNERLRREQMWLVGKR